MAFRIAGRQGTREALKAAGPVLLQPIFRIAIHAPAIFTGSLGPIVASHSGQVLGFDADPAAKGWEIFEALVPGSALGGARQRRPRLHPGRRLVRAPPSTTTRSCTARPRTASSRSAPRSPPDRASNPW